MLLCACSSPESDGRKAAVLDEIKHRLETEDLNPEERFELVRTYNAIMHDVGKGGGWIFISLISLVVAIWLLVLMSTNSEPEENRFGQPQK
jgi:hypothetical protein